MGLYPAIVLLEMSGSLYSGTGNLRIYELKRRYTPTLVRNEDPFEN